MIRRRQYRIVAIGFLASFPPASRVSSFVPSQIPHARLPNQKKHPIVIPHHSCQCLVNEEQRWKRPRSIVSTSTVAIASELYDDDDVDKDDSKKNFPLNIEQDGSRRKLISGSFSAIISCIIAGTANPIVSHADDNEYIDMDKVILQASSKNIPQKYASITSSSSTVSSSSANPVSSTSNVNMCENDPELRRINVFEKAAPSVVYIDTFVQQRDAFSTNVMEVPLGTGSGFVWDDKGHIVTNYHVVRSAQKAQVAILTRIFPNDDEVDQSGKSLIKSKDRQPGYDPNVADFTRKLYPAKVVGVDPGKDIAVLKVDAPVFDLYPIDVGTSKGLKVGQSAFAIGNPFGLDHTLTVGVVSGIGREVKSPIGRPISNVIQTDAAINPGNSGGPLLDSQGRLIGMNTSIFSPSGASAGIGFAIPVDAVKYIVETLIRDGRIIRPVMGISYLESKQARALGINKGVLVLDVPTSSPAFKAGMRGTRRTESGLLEIGDIIIQIEDIKIDTEADLFAALETFKPDDVVKVIVNRPDLEGPNSTKLKLKPKTLSVVLRASTDMTLSNLFYAPE